MVSPHLYFSNRGIAAVGVTNLVTVVAAPGAARFSTPSYARTPAHALWGSLLRGFIDGGTTNKYTFADGGVSLHKITVGERLQKTSLGFPRGGAKARVSFFFVEKHDA